MSAISDMIEGVKQADTLLADADLEPRAERADWPSAKMKLEQLRSVLQQDVAPHLEAALEEADGTELGPKIKRRVAYLYADAAAAFQASGDGLRAAELLAKAEKYATDPDLKDEIVAGQKEPTALARLVLARWLLHEQRFDDADREARRVRRETRQPALADRAKKLLAGPRPLRGSPPSLFTVNGIGTGLYGQRDRDSEGRYIATYCLCALFIPIFPISAYRVSRVGDKTYRFYAREKLSTFARAYQGLVGLAIVAAIAGSAIASYLESPERRAAIDLEEAKKTEAAGKQEPAMDAYRRIVDQTSPGDDSAQKAAAAVARLAANGVPSPCTATSIEPARRAASFYLSLPEAARASAPPADLTKKLDACATEIGDGDAEKARASLRVLDLASDVAKASPEASWVEQKRSAARRAFAGRMADARPLLALAQLVKLEDADSLAAAKQILLGLGDGPSLWIEAAPDIDRWEKSARGKGEDEAVKEVDLKLGLARAAHEKTAALLATAEEKDIAKAAAAHPLDQELAVALANAKRSHGDTKAALDLLAKLGPPGRLTAAAQEVLANTYADAGDLAKGDEILTALVDERLAPFQDAQQAYRAAAAAAEKRIDSDLKLGIAPPDLESRLAGVADDYKKREVIQRWFSEQMAAVPGLEALRADYLRHGSVVLASLSLGMIKLRRAADARGDERKRLLDEAERAFLSIRDEAADEPSFHIGLGQVYYRLGKNDEGEKELEEAQRGGSPIRLAVARTYRELGLDAKARKIAKDTYDSSHEEQERYDAANLLAYLASDIEDEESWLRKANPSDPGVRGGLERVAGERLLRDGKSAEADQKFKKCVEIFDVQARTNAVAANNAATETMRRYRATGDPAHLKTAASYLEAAVRLQPDNAIVLGNLAAALAHLGYVTVLDRWVDTRLLVLDYDDAQSLASSLSDGPLSADVLEALRKDPSYQRSLEVSKKQQVLAPQMVSAYYAQLAWLGWSHDIKGLEDLGKLVDLLPASADASGDLQEKWLSGEQDDTTSRARKDAVAAARRKVERTKSAPKPTQAVAWQGLGEALQGMAFFERDAALLDEIVAASRKARSLWPEGVSRADLAAALYAASFYRAMDASPSLKKAWEDGRRKHSGLVLGYLAATGDSAVEVTSALRKEPLLAEVVALRRETAEKEPTLNDYMMARVTGSDELLQASMKAFDSHEMDLRYSLAAKLLPTNEDGKILVKLFKSRGASH